MSLPGLDLGILSDKPLDTVAVTNELIRLLYLNRIDVVDLRRASPLLAREIVRQGVVLYERDPGGGQTKDSLRRACLCL